MNCTNSGDCLIRSKNARGQTADSWESRSQPSLSTTSLLHCCYRQGRRCKPRHRSNDDATGCSVGSLKVSPEPWILLRERRLLKPAAELAALTGYSFGEQRLLALDVMNDRAVSGTTDWKMYSVVLDVPSDAKNIFLGVLLNGKGQIWADDLTFEIVDRNIAVTNKGSAEGGDDPAYAKIPKATIKRPINLGF